MALRKDFCNWSKGQKRDGRVFGSDDTTFQNLAIWYSKEGARPKCNVAPAAMAAAGGRGPRWPSGYPFDSPARAAAVRDAPR